MPSFARFQVSLILLLLGAISCERRRVGVPVTPAPAAAARSPAPAAPEAQGSNSHPASRASQAPRKAAQSGTAPTPAAAAPKLGDVLSADEQKHYNASIEQSLAHAQASLNQIKEHRLSAAQADEVEQIRNFIQQAQGARASDLAGARSLAERAEVLAKDLAAALR